MPDPTFAGMPLFSAAARDLPHSSQLRLTVQTLPGVDGAYVQAAGRSTRRLRATGLLRGHHYTPALAHAALKTALRQRQRLVDGRTIADYVGVDGHRYAHCMLLSFQAAGAVRVSRDAAATWTAFVPCAGELLQLVSEP